MTNTLFHGSYLNRCVEGARLAVKWVIFFVISQGEVTRYMRMRRGAVFLLVRLGLYDKRELDFVRCFLKSGDLAVDVGANFGVYAQAMAQAVGLSGRVVAFEALHSTFESLSELCAKYPQLQCREIGISNGKQEFTEFHLPLLFGKIPEPALASIEGSDLPTATFRVPLTSLDKISNEFDRLRFIKVDIEGHEPEFFEGAMDTLKRFRPVVQFEENHPELRLDIYLNIGRSIDYTVCALDAGGKFQVLPSSAVAKGSNFYLVPSEQLL